MGDFFGTDGIRGRANRYPLTADMAVRIGRAIGILFGEADGGPPIIIGRDTRRSGQMLEAAVAADDTGALIIKNFFYRQSFRVGFSH